MLLSSPRSDRRTLGLITLSVWACAVNAARNLFIACFIQNKPGASVFPYIPCRK